MKKESQAIKDWKKCVRRAKKTLGLPVDSYVILSGKVLQRAMKAYCAMGY